PEVRPTFKRNSERQPKLSWGDVQELRTRFSAYEAAHGGRGVIRVRSISELLLHTGARIGEILALQRSDLDPDNLVTDDDSLDEYGLSIYIRATQKRLGGEWAEDGKRSGTQLIRQELPKGGKAGSRIVTISAAT